ncbi:MAG TPA: DUF1673 family protein [Candidatus Methanoperedens sp.]
MTINVMENIRKTMGWCPNASAFAAKRVLVALPVDEESRPGENGGEFQEYGGWANKYRNYVLLFTLVGLAGFAAGLLMIKLFEGVFHTELILKGIFAGIIYAIFPTLDTWKMLNRINQPEISFRKTFLISFIYIAFLMIIVLVLSLTIGKENPLLFMLLMFFPSACTVYPLVIYWERKNSKRIYLIEEKFLRWRPVALPTR